MEEEKHTAGKLNIAMLGHKRIPSREGGVEIVVEELSTRMVKKGHVVTCFNRTGHHISGRKYKLEKKKEYKGVKIKSVFTINRKGFAAATSSFFGALKSAFGKYDVVHFHAEGPCAMIWLPKLFGKKCIATIHGLDHQRAKWNKFASKYILLGEKCAVKYADEIIVLSENVKTYFKETYNRDTVYIPNGVSRPEIRKTNKIRKKYNLEKDSYLLYLGRIVPEKGVHYLIKAFIGVDTDKKLVIAGGSSDTDSYYNKLKEMAKDDKRIIFTGFVQGQTLEELYSNSYTYILPSDLEGMPLSLLEAMSYGNCCLVSSIAECTSVVEDKGFVFEKSNVNDLKEKIQYICDNKEVVEKYQLTAANYICGKYDWDNVVDRTLEIYTKI